MKMIHIKQMMKIISCVNGVVSASVDISKDTKKCYFNLVIGGDASITAKDVESCIAKLSGMDDLFVSKYLRVRTVDNSYSFGEEFFRDGVLYIPENLSDTYYRRVNEEKYLLVSPIKEGCNSYYFTYETKDNDRGYYIMDANVVKNPKELIYSLIEVVREQTGLSGNDVIITNIINISKLQ